jgi:peroxisomal membrane protein 2
MPLTILYLLLFLFQLVIDKAPKLDLKRTFVFTLLGLVLVGPTLHVW